LQRSAGLSGKRPGTGTISVRRSGAIHGAASGSNIETMSTFSARGGGLGFSAG